MTTPLWQHPAIALHHVVKMTREYPRMSEGSTEGSLSVATCQCGWESRIDSRKWGEQDNAVNGHWRDVIVQSEAAA